MGNLVNIWTDLPEDLAGLKDAFARHFGHNWAQVMVGAAKPLAYHQDWDALVAVSNLHGCRDLRLSGLFKQRATAALNIINIIAG